MELDEQEEAAAQRVNGGSVIVGGGYVLDDYAGEIADNVWTPDKLQPEKYINLAVRIRALTGQDLNRVNQQFQELRRIPALVNIQQDKLERCSLPREVGRKQKALDAIDEQDFTDDADSSAENYQSASDKAEARRVELEGEIKALITGWESDIKKITAETDRLLGLANMSAYELLRAEFFSRVIHSHDILWRGSLLDFSKAAEEGREPPDAFAGALYQHLLQVLRDEKKAKRRSGFSVKPSRG